MNHYIIKEALTQWANDKSETWFLTVNNRLVARSQSNKETLLSLLGSFTRRKIEACFNVTGFSISMQVEETFAKLFESRVNSRIEARLYDTLAQLIQACYHTDTFNFEPCANEYSHIFDVYLPKLGCTVQVKRTKDGFYWPIHD